MQKAGNKIIALIIGAAITLAVFGAIVLIMTRPDQSKKDNSSSGGIITANDFKNVKTETDGLKNFGDLPITLTKDEVGRSNPFEPY